MARSFGCGMTGGLEARSNSAVTTVVVCCDGTEGVQAKIASARSGAGAKRRSIMLPPETVCENRRTRAERGA